MLGGVTVQTWSILETTSSTEFRRWSIGRFDQIGEFQIIEKVIVYCAYLECAARAIVIGTIQRREPGRRMKLVRERAGKLKDMPKDGYRKKLRDQTFDVFRL
ncbi:hypothetical protein D0Y83_04990 [Qipengyuania flava]|uniref:Uncharacterized protein n=1 Tax=Qipengyuania flava TaxID=192812 RepID=A0A5P6N9J6_9SPHN|nr:hypothetical protein D0Y83_04990 [Qipengyuania flava]